MYQLEVLADVINNISHIGEDIPPTPPTPSRTDALAFTMNDWASVYLRGCFLGKGVGQFWETFKRKGSLCVTLLYPYYFATEIMKLLVSSTVLWILSVLQVTLTTTCSKCWLLQFVNWIFSVHRNKLKLLLQYYCLWNIKMGITVLSFPFAKLLTPLRIFKMKTLSGFLKYHSMSFFT